ncbi:IS66 family transposase [Caldimonas brevitalea]|uniref:IS66 family transposase n=1 Tax=Caldimonas brevitalea TaxID=413882 RepID=UPI00069BCC32
MAAISVEDYEALKDRLAQRERELLLERLLVEKLKLEIARLRRDKFGASSERLEHIEQLELLVEDLETRCSALPDGEAQNRAPSAPAHHPPARKSLPPHLPRETVRHEPGCSCSECGVELRYVGEDVAEVLELVPQRFKVVRHVRPKYSCPRCQTLVQMPAPSRPIARGLAGVNLLAHVLVSKFADHLPLYRQSEIYAREGVELERSTLADWVGSASRLLEPLMDALQQYVLSAEKLHADDTPVAVLAPGKGRTKTGRLWAYVRDERPMGSQAPPAVWFQYSPDRKGERPQGHLKRFNGVLQADGYAGFEALYEQGRVVEAACWAHARRKFFDLHQATNSPQAHEALRRIGELYEVERHIRGRPPEERWRVRQEHAVPKLQALRGWLDGVLAGTSSKSELARAIRYSLGRWPALVRYAQDGRVEIDNNAAEREIRAVALGRKNWLFAGSDAGGERAATLYSLIGTAKLNGLDPQAYLAHVLEHIGEHRVDRVAELLPWNVASLLDRGAVEELQAA